MLCVVSFCGNFIVKLIDPNSTLDRIQFFLSLQCQSCFPYFRWPYKTSHFFCSLQKRFLLIHDIPRSYIHVVYQGFKLNCGKSSKTVILCFFWLLLMRATFLRPLGHNLKLAWALNQPTIAKLSFPKSLIHTVVNKSSFKVIPVSLQVPDNQVWLYL